MVEYIDREAVLKAGQNVKMNEVVPNCREPAIKEALFKHGQAIKKLIIDFPAADVVEVVRCKDCKRCYEKRTKRNKQLMLFCMRMDGREYQVNADDFCSYGVRKGDNNG